MTGYMSEMRKLVGHRTVIQCAASIICVNSGPETHYIYPNGDEVSNFEIVFICRKWTGEPRALDGEMEELRFFSCSEIDLSEISPPIRPVVKEYIEKAIR